MFNQKFSKKSLTKLVLASLSLITLSTLNPIYAQSNNAKTLSPEEIISLREITYKKCVSNLPSTEKNVNILNNILKQCMAENGFSFGDSNQNSANSESQIQNSSKKKSSEELLNFYKKRAEVSKQCAIKFKNEADILSCVNGTP